MDYLEIKNLSFQYAGAKKPTLKELTLGIEQGSFVLVCGASGSGKSTFLKLLKPQLTPAGQIDGQIFLGNQALEQLPESYSTCQIGYVMQNPESQIITENVWHELAFGLENIGLAPQEMKSRIAEMVNFLGIQELVEKPTKELSGGEKQLVNLAAVLVMRPTLLILDEPTTQLDPIASQNFMEILVRLNHEMGMTIILAEHALETIFPLADQVILLDEGRLVTMQAPRNLTDHLQENISGLERFLVSLPSSTQIYQQLAIGGTCPLTVLEGKRWLGERFGENRAITLAVEEPQTSTTTALKMKDCWFRYGKAEPDVLKGVNLEIKQGEIFSLVGGNGTGKSTLLKTIAGILPCYHGKLTLFGKPLKRNQGTVAYLPQVPSLLFVKDSVVEDYHAYLASQKNQDRLADEVIQQVAQALDIKGILGQHPLDLSGGELQRAALGKLLLANPELLLLDEPTKGIDNYGKKQLIKFLKTLSQQGKTIFVVTHDLDFAAELSTRCGLFFQNNLLREASPQVFFSNHAFYTTAASRISREVFPSLVTVEQVVAACRKVSSQEWSQ